MASVRSLRKVEPDCDPSAQEARRLSFPRERCVTNTCLCACHVCAGGCPGWYDPVCCRTWTSASQGQFDTWMASAAAQSITGGVSYANADLFAKCAQPASPARRGYSRDRGVRPPASTCRLNSTALLHSMHRNP